MKNILGETARTSLHGRLRFSSEAIAATELSGRRVLDVGCGYGWYLLNALDKGAAFVAGIEPSESALETARSDPELRRHAALRVGDSSHIPFESDFLDVVTCWEVLEHIPKGDEAILFSEIFRVLRPGGQFLLSTPFHSFFSTYFDPAYWLVKHRHYSRETIRALAATAGFLVDKMEVKGRWAELYAIYNLYISKWIFRRPPIFQAHMNTMLDRDWTASASEGFMNVVARFRKPIVEPPTVLL